MERIGEGGVVFEFQRSNLFAYRTATKLFIVLRQRYLAVLIRCQLLAYFFLDWISYAYNYDITRSSNR